MRMEFGITILLLDRVAGDCIIPALGVMGCYYLMAYLQGKTPPGQAEQINYWRLSDT